MIILGISAYYHDSSAALVVDGKIISAALEERFTRKKHDNRFPINACRYCLDSSGISIEKVDEVVFFEKPFTKFDRILRSHIQYAPKGITMFVKTLPIWLKERLNMKRTIQKELRKEFKSKANQISFVDHHLAHAANSFYQSGFSESAIIVIDAVGENSTTSIYKADPKGCRLIEYQEYPHSLGLLYSAVTYYLGFKVNSDEYKVMGLAPYGDPTSPETKRYIEIISSRVAKISKYGEIHLDDKAFAFMYSDHMIEERTWHELFGISRRKPNDEISQSHKNLAYAIQSVYEDALFKIATKAKDITGATRLCLSGGCAMNCAANGKLLRGKIFEDVYIPYAPDDSGCSIGAALAVTHLKYRNKIRINDTSYLGPEFSNSDIHDILKRMSIPYRYVENSDLFKYISKRLSEQKIIGWFQGRMEFGPRALGNRSILADPRNPAVKDLVNSKIKFRESFRPFAPVVLQEYLSDVFLIGAKYGKHMSYTCQVNSDSFPGITHVDRTARIQVLNRDTNEMFYELLTEFYKQTNCPLLLNTSFNVMGDPIVCSPEDALHTFKKSGIDILVLGNYIIEK